MKKMLCVLSVLVLIMSTGTACGKKETAVTEITSETEITTTVPPFTESNGVISRRVDIDENTYEIYYIDENGNALKTEHYSKDKLVYYYTDSKTDASGNVVQQEYYNSSKKLIATFKNGVFYNSSGKQITEEEMDSILSKAQ